MLGGEQRGGVRERGMPAGEERKIEKVVREGVKSKCVR